METVWIEVVKQLPFAGAIIWVVFQLLKGFAAERKAMMEFYTKTEDHRLEVFRQRDEKMEATIAQNTDAINHNTEVLGETKATMLLLKASLNGTGPHQD